MPVSPSLFSCSHVIQDWISTGATCQIRNCKYCCTACNITDCLNCVIWVNKQASTIKHFVLNSRSHSVSQVIWLLQTEITPEPNTACTKARLVLHSSCNDIIYWLSDQTLCNLLPLCHVYCGLVCLRLCGIHCWLILGLKAELFMSESVLGVRTA